MSEPNKELLEIHENSLEKDCSDHSKLAFEWGMALAEAKAKTKRAKNKLKVTEAEVTKDFRLRPAKYGLDKVTEGTTETVLSLSDAVKVARELYIQAEYEEDILQAFVYALKDRKEALSDMVRLHGQMYFSRPDTTAQDRVADSQAARPKRTMRD